MNTFLSEEQMNEETDYQPDRKASRKKGKKITDLLAFMREEKNAFFICESLSSNTELAFKTNRGKDSFTQKLYDFWYVGTLVGPNSHDWKDYGYIGIIVSEDDQLVFKSVGKVSLEVPQETIKIWDWIWRHRTELEGKVEITKLI